MLSVNLHRFITNNIPKGCWPDYFYHYTKKCVLPLICSRDGRILATQATYLSDKEEMVLGADMCVDFLEHKRGWGVSFCADLRKEVRNLIVSSCVENPLALQVVPWVVSLSSRKNSPQMWYSYSKGGGYCLVFSQQMVRKGIELLNRQSSLQMFSMSVRMLMPCVYLSKHDVDAYIRAYFDDLGSEFGPAVERNLLIANILIAATFIKNRKYAYEHEWRIAMLPSLAAYHKQEWIFTGPARIPRLSVGLELCVEDFRQYIAGVMVSPHGDHDHMRAIAKRCRANTGMKIEVSGLPTDYESLADYIDRKNLAYELHK